MHEAGKFGLIVALLLSFVARIVELYSLRVQIHQAVQVVHCDVSNTLLNLQFQLENPSRKVWRQVELFVGINLVVFGGLAVIRTAQLLFARNDMITLIPRPLALHSSLGSIKRL